jgi:predicted glycoside hydrolase/deacetylase ChbG (UPF0249 family)
LKKLIVNADDFGFTRDVNEGIVAAHRRGILTATTIMATGEAFAHAVELSRENPDLDVGCHLVLVGSEGFPPTIPRLLYALATRRIRIYDELATQVRRILDADLRPTHLDTHKHTHILPPVLDAVARISEEYGIPWVRRPLLLGRALSKHGCRTTDHFAGFRMTGKYDAAQLANLIRKLPEGITEFMCHPGFCTPELRSARTRLKESRQRELEALTSPEVREALSNTAVELISYRSLVGQVSNS